MKKTNSRKVSSVDAVKSVLELLEKSSTREIAPEVVMAKLARAGHKDLQLALVRLGLRGKGFPEDRNITAGTLVALKTMGAHATRSTGPKTVDGLIKGKLYASDPASVVFRYAIKRGTTVEIWTVNVSYERGRTFEHESTFDADAVDPDLSKSVPAPKTFTELRDEGGEDKEGVVPEEDNDRRRPSEKVGNTGHYKADIKLVYWIPYHANPFPVPTRFLPGNWEQQNISQEFRMALRLMLSTGNPTPPDGFPTKAAWDAFVASKEYRGYLWTQLAICCPDKNPKIRRTVRHAVGYTPPPTNIRKGAQESDKDFADRLNQEHKDNECVGSMVEGIVTGSGAGAQSADSLYGFPYVQEWGVPDNVDDAAEELRKRYKGKPHTPHSFSDGEEIFREDPRGSDCALGHWVHWLRVGKIHNILNFILTGKIIPYQGGEVAQQLCCDGQLQINQQYTGIPSLRLYVNNVKVWQYDMLSAPFDRIRSAFEQQGLDTSLGALDKQDVPALDPTIFNLYKQQMRRLCECPGDLFPPGSWPYDGV